MCAIVHAVNRTGPPRSAQMHDLRRARADRRALPLGEDLSLPDEGLGLSVSSAYRTESPSVRARSASA